MDIVRGEFESLGYISSRERSRAEYLTRAKSPVRAEIAITVAAGSRVVLDRCGIRRIKRGPASCHNRQSKHRGSRSAISNLCFASALITYGNGHPVDPCTHTRTRSLHPRVARVSIVGLPVWFTVLERDDTSANDIDAGVTRIFSSNNGRKKKRRNRWVSLSLHEFANFRVYRFTFPTCLLQFLRFLRGSSIDFCTRCIGRDAIREWYACN